MLEQGSAARRAAAACGHGGTGEWEDLCAAIYVAELARESAVALTAHTALVEEISFPLWITAGHLLEQAEGLDGADAVLGALERQPGLAGVLTPFLRVWLVRRCAASHADFVGRRVQENHSRYQGQIMR